MKLQSVDEEAGEHVVEKEPEFEQQYDGLYDEFDEEQQSFAGPESNSENAAGHQHSDHNLLNIPHHSVKAATSTPEENKDVQDYDTSKSNNTYSTADDSHRTSLESAATDGVNMVSEKLDFTEAKSKQAISPFLEKAQHLPQGLQDMDSNRYLLEMILLVLIIIVFRRCFRGFCVVHGTKRKQEAQDRQSTQGDAAASSPLPSSQQRCFKSISVLGSTLREKCQHLVAGTRMLCRNTKEAFYLSQKCENLTRRERLLLERATSDLLRLVPFSFFIIVPGAEFLLPLAIPLFPSLIPSTFESDSQRFNAAASAEQDRVKGRQELMELLQAHVTEAVDTHIK